MATFEQDRFMQTLQEILADAWYQIGSNIITGEATGVAWVLETRYGYRCLTASYSVQEDEIVLHYILLTLAASEVETIRGAVAMGWLSGVEGVRFNYDQDNSSNAQILQIWQDYRVAPIVAIIDEWTNGSAESPTYHQIQGAGTRINSATATIKVTGDIETFTIWRTLNWLTPKVPNAFVSYVSAVSSAEITAPVVGEGAAVAELAKIAAGVSDLAHRSVVQTINNGSAIADLYTGDVITPP